MSVHVAVLLGGWSEEREVSLTSGRAVVVALESLGYRASPVDVTPGVATDLDRLRPDVVFNALHGRYGEDGCIQGVLETLGLPYTHSGVLASALAMDKPAAKRMFAAAGLRCAEGLVTTRNEILREPPFPYPFVVKPLNEGSSVGVSIVMDAHGLGTLAPSDEEVLVERYIPGREIQVAVLDGAAIGAIEIRPKSGFYDYEAKYTAGKADHLMPAPIAPEAYREVLSLAERAHAALGCRGLTRSDFRYDDTEGEPGIFYLLEINTQPGMTPLSLAPEIAAHAGISFPALCDTLIQEALALAGNHTPSQQRLVHG